MEFLLKEIESALQNKLYFIALQSTLALPDICGALQSQNGMATKNNYITWYDTYAKEQSSNAISGEDCYYFRCSCLHQGSSQNPNSSYSRIMFVIPYNGNVFHNNIINGALNIDINCFCSNIISAVRKWEQQIKNDSNFKKNYDKLMKVHPNGISPNNIRADSIWMKVHPNGISPYIVGAPVIS